MAHIRPRVLLESAAPQTLLALAATGYGIAILPSNAVCRGEGSAPFRWFIAAPRSAGGRTSPGIRSASGPPSPSIRDELEAHCRRNFPGRDLVRRAPPLAKPPDHQIDGS